MRKDFNGRKKGFRLVRKGKWAGERGERREEERERERGKRRRIRTIIRRAEKAKEPKDKCKK